MPPILLMVLLNPKALEASVALGFLAFVDEKQRAQPKPRSWTVSYSLSN
jgi:hypothetical protein